jgi:H+/Cl- antiporter ClcA
LKRLPFQPIWSALRDVRELLGYVAKWLGLVLPVGAAIGSACALFLWTLDQVTTLRFQQPYLLYWLPVAGVLVGLLYHWLGRSVEGGSNLVVDEIHEPGGGVPTRIVPLVFIGTILTHLCGGSAGREGTAVQMGGGIASAFARMFKFLSPADTRTLLMSGVAGGFGGVFGTPLAGAVFAMEVLAIGRISYEAVLPCLLAAIVADYTCGAWGIGHTPYHIAMTGGDGLMHIDWWLLGKVAIAGAAFGLAARLFAELAHSAQHLFKSLIKIAYLRPALGGIGVIGLSFLFGSDYLGIGVTSPDSNAVSIVSSFQAGGAHPWSWILKIVFTVMTIASGFKGGEVTPLFFIGAALGNALAGPMGAPVDLFAGLGFVAVFAAAANTPLACTIMAVELFGTGGGPHVVYFAVACFAAYFFSGHTGIYLSQRIGVPKVNIPTCDGMASQSNPSLRSALDNRANHASDRQLSGSHHDDSTR